MDLFNGEIISYRMKRRPVFSLVTEMLNGALDKLKFNEKPLIHSDQGWQYRMPFYRNKLAENGLRQSMSRKGNCLDNAAMESFFAVLKTECFYTDKFETLEQLEATLHEYIHYYNQERIKLKLKGLIPVQYRNQPLQPA